MLTLPHKLLIVFFEFSPSFAACFIHQLPKLLPGPAVVPEPDPQLLARSHQGHHGSRWPWNATRPGSQPPLRRNCHGHLNYGLWLWPAWATPWKMCCHFSLFCVFDIWWYLLGNPNFKKSNTHHTKYARDMMEYLARVHRCTILMR